MHWECLRLPKPKKRLDDDHVALSIWLEGPDPEDPSDKHRRYGPNMAAENRDLLFYPQIPGDVQLRNLWYMQHRRRPMTPAPCTTPMPDKQKDAEQKARYYSTYLRPWTLDPSTATSKVPYIANLDIVMGNDAGPCPAPHTGSSNASHEHPQDGIGPCPAQSEKATTASQESPNKRRVRLRSKTVDETQPQRSYAMAWRTYIRGHVVTRHAARLITQFMAACCGTTKSHDNEEEPNEGPGIQHNIPNNTLPLERVHNILDRMSAMEPRAPKAKKRKKSEEEEEKKEVEEDDYEAASRALQQSEVVSTAMQVTARLWSRTAQQWPDDTPPDTRASLDVTSATATAATKRCLTKKKSQRPKKVQTAAYIA